MSSTGVERRYASNSGHWQNSVWISYTRQFFDARGTKDLLQGIQRALVAPYDVLDASGRRVSGGRLGEKAIALPVGTYAVVVHASGEPITIANVQVAYNQLTKVELKKEGQAVGTRVVRVAP
jgi:hypothetical protein